MTQPSSEVISKLKSIIKQKGILHIFDGIKFNPPSKRHGGLSSQGLNADGLVEHSGHADQLLKKVDDLRIADNIIVIWSTDNGAEVFAWLAGLHSIDWMVDEWYVRNGIGQTYVHESLQPFKEFLVCQRPADFNSERVLNQI